MLLKDNQLQPHLFFHEPIRSYRFLTGFQNHSNFVPSVISSKIFTSSNQLEWIISLIEASCIGSSDQIDSFLEKKILPRTYKS